MAIERENAELGLRLAHSLARFWYYRGHYSEGRVMGTTVLALPAPPEMAALRAEVLLGTGRLAMRQGDYQAHRAHLDEGVAIARQVGDTRLLVSMLVNLGFGARVHEDYAAARLALAEGLALARQEGGTFDTATALHHLGLLALEADRDLEAAWTLSEQSLALYRQIGSRRQVAVVLESMGRVARARGQLLEARRLLVEGLSALWTIGDLGPLPQTLYALAAVDADSGQIERAVQLQVAAMEMEVTVGTQVWPVHRREHDGWWGMAATTLGGARPSRACAEGRAMSVEQVVAYALEKSGSFDAP